MPFWASIGILSLIQGGLIAVPASWEWAQRHLGRLRSGWWALLPLASILAVAYGLDAVAVAPQGLTYLALVCVPILAALALGWAMHGARPWLAVAVVPLFALAWAVPARLWGEGAATALTALSCVGLGVILVGLAPAPLLKLGIIAMSAADVVLVYSQQLQHPNTVLGTAHPVAQLPKLQTILFGSAVMGYGDLFVAGLAGALLARRPAVQRRAAVLAIVLALAFDLLFFRVTVLPATVPIAVTVIIVEAGTWFRARRRAADGVPGRASRSLTG